MEGQPSERSLAKPSKHKKTGIYQQFRRELPVYQERVNIIRHVREWDSLVVVGETGSGKTTQIPQYLLEARIVQPDTAVAVTQPRRVAAITVAQRVANEMETRLGGLVGYSVRFDDKSSPYTRLKYLTDGMLLREALIDYQKNRGKNNTENSSASTILSKYSVIVVDEAHERTVHTDVLFGLLKRIQRHRAKTSHPLKIIIMSATLNAETFASYFDARILHIPGRQFPVKTYFASESHPDYVEACLVTILQVHMENGKGDMLVFLTGREEIENLKSMLESRLDEVISHGFAPYEVLPIYAALPPDEQIKVFQPTNPSVRKIVLATNIAETSITINGICFVIDCGLTKTRVYNPNTGMDSLIVVPISKAACRQRTGRAGREQAGVCYRLFTQETFDSLAEHMLPEILLCDLSSVLLLLKGLGVDDVLAFDFLDRPPLESYRRGRITALGAKMAKLPLNPMLALALFNSEKYQCTVETIMILSMLSIDHDSIFFVPNRQQKEAEKARMRFFAVEGDHFVLLNVFKGYLESSDKKDWCFVNFVNFRSMKTAMNVFKQLKTHCEQMKIPLVSCGENSAPVVKCFVSSFFLNLATHSPYGSENQNSSNSSNPTSFNDGGKVNKKHRGAMVAGGNLYITVSDSKLVTVHPSSVLSGQKVPYLLFHESVTTTKHYVRIAMRIELEDIVESCPDIFKSKFVSAMGRIDTN